MCAEASPANGGNVRREPERTDRFVALGTMAEVTGGSDAEGQHASEAARADVVADPLLQHGAPPLWFALEPTW